MGDQGSCLAIARSKSQGSYATLVKAAHQKLLVDSISQKKDSKKY
jgi:hypothetical protein